MPDPIRIATSAAAVVRGGVGININNLHPPVEVPPPPAGNAGPN